jgi:Ankyrin repeats (many copies)
LVLARKRTNSLYRLLFAGAKRGGHKLAASIRSVRLGRSSFKYGRTDCDAVGSRRDRWSSFQGQRSFHARCCRDRWIRSSAGKAVRGLRAYKRSLFRRHRLQFKRGLHGRNRLSRRTLIRANCRDRSDLTALGRWGDGVGQELRLHGGRTNGRRDDIYRLHRGPQALLAQARAGHGATRQAPKQNVFEQILHYMYEGDTALHMAAAAYQTRIVDELIVRGADIRARNRRGAEPLHYAVDGGPGSSAWD